MKDVAATIHELECNPSVYRMTTAAKRLQHAQCMLRIVWLFQNYSCAFNDGVYTHYDVDTSTARCKNLITRAIKTGRNESKIWAALRGQNAPSQMQWPPHICKQLSDIGSAR